MPKKYTSICCSCGKAYEGRGKFFCSTSCAVKFRAGVANLDFGTFCNVLESMKPDKPRPLVVNTRRIAICGDFHFPYVDTDMLDKLLQIAKIYIEPPRELVIAGDLVDFTSISHFDITDKRADLNLDLNSARMGLNLLLGVFDKIYYLMGNHDIRYLRKLDWFISESELGQGILNNERLITTRYPYMSVVSNGNEFYIVHPKSYSRVGKVPVDLVAKLRKPVLSFHGHLFHIRTEPSGYDFGYDVGCMTVSSYHNYIHERVTTHPEWTRGFCLIIDGSIFPFTSNPKITNWQFWLEEMPSRHKLSLLKRKGHRA